MYKISSLQDHFDLITNGALGRTRYIDYLNEDASLNYLIFKPRHGKNIIKRPSDHHKKSPDEQKYSTEAIERYGCFSEQVDLNSNLADLLVIKNDPEIPIMDYLVVLQGSPLMTSHFNHIANVLPHWHSRDTYDKVSTVKFVKIVHIEMILSKEVYRITVLNMFSGWKSTTTSKRTNRPNGCC